MKNLYIILFLSVAFIFGGCNSDIAQNLIANGENSVENQAVSYSIPKDSLDKYYRGLESINEEISKDLNFGTRGNGDINNTIAADIKGAALGAKMGWHMGSNIFTKIGLSIIMGAIIGGLCSSLAAINIGLFANGYGIASDSGSIDDISQYKYEYVENGLLESALNSYAYRCEDLICVSSEELENMNVDFSCLSETDASRYLNMIPEIDFYDKDCDSTFSVCSDKIGSIHNDVLYSMINHGTPAIELETTLNQFQFMNLKSPLFVEKVEDVSYHFQEYGNDWVTDDGIKLMEDVNANTNMFFYDQEKLINETVNSYIREVEKYVAIEPENYDYFVNRLSNQYISYISSKTFIYDYTKHIIFSSIIVGAYSSQYWKYESGI